MDVNLNSKVLPVVQNQESIILRLNRLVRLMRKHLDMDVAFISEFTESERLLKIVDTKHINPIVEAGASDPLNESYCKRITDNELDNIINDTKSNQITRDMPVTKKLNIGSYLGVPITLSSGDIYGTFCCYKEQKDETLNKRDLSFLQLVSDLASEIIDKQLQEFHEIETTKAKIIDVITNNNVKMHYQPIYSLKTNSPVGYESLSRFNSEPYRPPNIWFSEAEKIGLGESLEMLAIKNTLKSLGRFDTSQHISINTSPDHILSGAVSKVFADIADCSNIVLEITEHSPVYEYQKIVSILEPLRNKGLRLAVDDVGAGYSSFKHILELQADIIKFDSSLVRDINKDCRKFVLAKALCSFAEDIGCEIIAEGVETSEEVNSLRTLGIDKVQGYYLGYPQPIDNALQHQTLSIAQ